MRIVVGFVQAAEGRAALDRAIEEARARDAELLVVHSHKGGERDELETVLSYREAFTAVDQRLKDEGIRYRLIEFARGNSPSEDLVQVAAEENAEMIVIGMRRRTAVGKLILGSNAQDVLLGADCAVLTVKALEDD